MATISEIEDFPNHVEIFGRLFVIAHRMYQQLHWKLEKR